MVEKYYTPKQVAEILQIHPYTVLKWIREGKLKAIKFGRVYRTTETELGTFLGTIRPNSRISTEVSQSSVTQTQAGRSVSKKQPPQKTQKPQKTQNLDVNQPELEKSDASHYYNLESQPQQKEQESPEDHYIL